MSYTKYGSDGKPKQAVLINSDGTPAGMTEFKSDGSEKYSRYFDGDPNKFSQIIEKNLTERERQQILTVTAKKNLLISGEKTAAPRKGLNIIQTVNFIKLWKITMVHLFSKTFSPKTL